MLQQGFEPVQVMKDGNCLFHSVAFMCSKYRVIDLGVIKLGAIVDGCINESFYLDQVLSCLALFIFKFFFTLLHFPPEPFSYLLITQIMKREDPEPFLHSITTEAVLCAIPKHLSGRDRIRAIFEKEILETTMDGRYSGLLEIIFFILF